MFTDMVVLQNRENNEVPCKIVQQKELCAISASASSFRLENGAKTPRIIVRRSKEIICKLLRPPAVGPTARLSLAWEFVASHIYRTGRG
jgi:hypothetical protein